MTATQSRFVNVELIGIDSALNDGFSEPVGRCDEYHVGKPRLGIEREHHAAGADVAAYHMLHADGQGDGTMIETLVDAIGNGPIVVERGVNLVHCRHQAIEAAHIEERLLLPGERGVRQILGRGRRANGHREVRPAVRSPWHPSFRLSPRPVAAGSGVAMIHLRICSPSLASLSDVIHVEPLENRRNSPGEAVLTKKIPICLRRRCKSAGNPYAESGKVPDHFPQRCVLAADDVQCLRARVARGGLRRVPSQPPLCCCGGRGQSLKDGRESNQGVMNRRTVFFVSDQTGVTAETLGRSLLTQFEAHEFDQVTVPFIDSVDKADEVVRRINAVAVEQGSRPIVFSTSCQGRIARAVHHGIGTIPGFLRGFPVAAGARTPDKVIAYHRPRAWHEGFRCL